VSQIRIFGREPALVMGAIGAVLAWIATLGFEWMNAGQSTALITFLSAGVIALTTRPWAPALFVGVISAGASLAAAYQLHWSEEAVTGLGTIVLTVCALFGIRSQVTPAADPAPISPATGNVR
jgi:hypothetical protein